MHAQIIDGTIANLRPTPAGGAWEDGQWLDFSDPATLAAWEERHGYTLTQCVGIAQLSTDSTQWYLVYGGSAAQTAIALGTSLGAPDARSTIAWELAIYAPPLTANTFTVQVTNLTTKAQVVQTISGTSTQVPQSSTLLAPKLWKTNNATALAVAFDLASLYIETDY